MANPRPVKCLMLVDLTDDLLGPFLQHIRDFDNKHTPDCHFAISAHHANKSTDELQEVLKSLDRPFPFVMVAGKV